MIVDTSAVLALLLGEEGADRIDAALQADPAPRIAAPTWVELFVVVNRKLRPQAAQRARRILLTYGVRIEPFTPEHAEVAARALRDYGKGSGHPAGLNLGDSYSYALASVTGEPLLFVGNDFTHTDITPALPHS